jgi:glycerol-3-phosphate acyltransferase PlsY
MAAVSVPLILIVRENIFNIDSPGDHTILPFCIALALLVIFTHRANVERLLSGTEKKISLAKNKSHR